MIRNKVVRAGTGAVARCCKDIFLILALSAYPLTAAYPQTPAPAADSTAPAQAANATTPAPAANPTVPPAPRRPAKHVSYFHTEEINPHARDFYQVVWGIDMLKVKSVESGQMIRFSYQVVDGGKATQLNDKKATPYLIDERARVSLVVPSMEKVGQLRQSSTPEAGRTYWMVFSNKGRVVKPGDSVSIVIGKFRANGLFVQ
jgi:hypothetical protein